MWFIHVHVIDFSIQLFLWEDVMSKVTDQKRPNLSKKNSNSGPVEFSQSIHISFHRVFTWVVSPVSGSGGPITAAHSGHIPSHPAIVPMPSGSPYPVVPIHSLSSHSGAKTSDKPKYESKGVCTETAPPVPIAINESLISLLIKLHFKLSGKTGSYVPLSMCKRLPSVSRVGDGPHFVTNLLDKMSQQSSDCAKLIEETYRQLVPKDGEDRKQKASHKEERQGLLYLFMP